MTGALAGATALVHKVKAQPSLNKPLVRSAPWSMFLEESGDITGARALGLPCPESSTSGGLLGCSGPGLAGPLELGHARPLVSCVAFATSCSSWAPSLPFSGAVRRGDTLEERGGWGSQHCCRGAREVQA